MKTLFVNERGIRLGRVILALAIITLIISLILAPTWISDRWDAYLDSETAKRYAQQPAQKASGVSEKTGPQKPAATRTKGEGKKKTRPAPATASAADAGLPPNMFTTKETCRAAQDSRNFRHYEPKYFSRRKENPVDGVSRVVAPLEAERCVHMLTTNGMQWVVQKEGTLFRFHAANGMISSPIPYARDDCGNPVDDIDPKGPMTPATTAVPKVVATLTANPTRVQQGGSTVLSYACANATSAKASGYWGGERSPQGGIETIFDLRGANKSFTLTCIGPGGTANAIVTVEVESKVSETKPEPTVVETITYMRRDRPAPVRRFISRDFYDYGEPVRYVEQYPRYVDGGGGGFVFSPVFVRGGDSNETVNITRNQRVRRDPPVTPTNVTRTRPIGGGGGASNITRTRP